MDGSAPMSAFELSFGLTSVILGLAVTHMANALRKLLLKEREVVWAPEPLLLAFLLLVITVGMWMSQFDRNKTGLSQPLALLDALKMLTIYFAAGFSLPEPEPGEPTVDLLAYYNRTRRFSFGFMVAGLMTSWVYNAIAAPQDWRADLASKALPIGLYGVLMFARWRWLNLLILGVMIIGTAYQLTQS
jgi:hypothetical protein